MFDDDLSVGGKPQSLDKALRPNVESNANLLPLMLDSNWYSPVYLIFDVASEEEVEGSDIWRSWRAPYYRLRSNC